MRTCLLYTLLALLLTACGGDKPTIAEVTEPSPHLDFRPNILWLVAEDLGPYLPSFGDSTVETPNLSRLAAEGVRYTRCFSPSGVCAPSRAAISTGMYPTHIGAMHMRTGGNPQYFPPDLKPYEALPPPEVKMHSEYLRRAGYYCTNNAKEDYQFNKPVTAWDESGRQAHFRNRPSGKPFFAIFNFEVTHESRIWAKAQDSLWIDSTLDVPIPPYLPDNEIGKRDVRRMYSNIKEMDSQIGKILDQLEADGLMDNTIIFWYADHGGPLPRMKRLLYDSGMHLPLIIRFPGKYRAGEIDEQLISFVDFKPTILSLAGIEPPGYLDGRAFLGDSRAPGERAYVHGAADRFDMKYDMIRAVRDKRFKYLRNFRTEQGYYLPVAYREQMPIMKELLRMRDAGELTPSQAQWFRDSKPREELFDTDVDPHELNNLAEDPTYADKLAELRTECDRWMEEVNDLGRMSEPEFWRSIWPDGQQPVTLAPEREAKGDSVTLRSATAGASIGYQVLQPGESPGKSWQVYEAPFVVGVGERVVAVAHRIGYKPSGEVSF